MYAGNTGLPGPQNTYIYSDQCAHPTPRSYYLPRTMKYTTVQEDEMDSDIECLFARTQHPPAHSRKALLRLTGASLPCTFYNVVPGVNDQLEFEIGLPDRPMKADLRIDGGYYDGPGIAAQIQTQLHAFTAAELVRRYGEIGHSTAVWHPTNQGSIQHVLQPAEKAFGGVMPLMQINLPTSHTRANKKNVAVAHSSGTPATVVVDIRVTYHAPLRRLLLSFGPQHTAVPFQAQLHTTDGNVPARPLLEQIGLVRHYQGGVRLQAGAVYEESTHQWSNIEVFPEQPTSHKQACMFPKAVCMNRHLHAIEVRLDICRGQELSNVDYDRGRVGMSSVLGRVPVDRDSGQMLHIHPGMSQDPVMMELNSFGHVRISLTNQLGQLIDFNGHPFSVSYTLQWIQPDAPLVHAPRPLHADDFWGVKTDTNRKEKDGQLQSTQRTALKSSNEYEPWTHRLRGKLPSTRQNSDEQT